MGQAGPSEGAPSVADTGDYMAVHSSSAQRQRLVPVLAVAVAASFSRVGDTTVAVPVSSACALALSDLAASGAWQGCRVPSDSGGACVSVTS